MINDKDLRALGNDAFVLECKEIKLIPASSGPEKIVYAGPGSVSQTVAGTFHVKVYCQGSVHPKHVFASTSGSAPGKLIADDEYFHVEAKDFHGNTWRADRILPSLKSGAGFKDYIIEAQCRKLWTKVTVEIAPDADSVSIFYRGDITIPSNTVTETKTKIGERIAKQGWDLNAGLFEAAGMEFEVVSEAGWLCLDAVSKGQIIEYATALRISEALQFVLARKLAWSCIKIWQKNTQTTFISAVAKNEKRTRIQPPLAFGAIDKDGGVWMLFGSYLTHTLGHLREDWHPIFRRIQAVVTSGEASIEAQGLTLSVAVEGLLNDALSEIGQPDSEFKGKVKATHDLICKSEIDHNIKKRVVGFVDNMVFTRAKDRLRVLRDAGLIDKNLIENWDSLRNPSTHGDVADWQDLQKYIDKCASVLALFYQLIFLAIGYKGDYTDYSSEGYPTKVFNKQLP